MPNIYLIIAAVAVLGFIGWKLDNNGYSRCDAKYKVAAVKAEQQATIKIETIRQESEQRLKDIDNAPITDDESVIAPVLRNTLDGMHARHGNDK